MFLSVVKIGAGRISFAIRDQSSALVDAEPPSCERVRGTQPNYRARHVSLFSIVKSIDLNISAAHSALSTENSKKFYFEKQRLRL